MADETVGSTPFESQVKAEFQEKIRQADTAEKKKSLVEELLAALREAVEAAQEAVQKTNEVNTTGVIPPEVQTAKEKAAKPILQLFELFSGNNNAPVDQEAVDKMALNDIQKSFLERISQSQHNADSSAFVAKIVDKTLRTEGYITLAAEGDPQTDFEKDFEQIKNNAKAAESVREATVKLAREGKIKDTKGNVLTEQQVRKLMKLKEKEVDFLKLEEIQRKLVAYRQRLQQGNKREEQENIARRNSLVSQMNALENEQGTTSDQKEERKNKLNSELAKVSAEGENIASRHEAIGTYLQTGEVIPPFKTPEEVETYLKSNLEFKDNEVREMKDLYQQLSEMPFDSSTSERMRGYGTGYEDLQLKINRDYNFDKMYEKIIQVNPETGQIELSKAAVNDLLADIEDDIGILFASLYDSPKSEYNEAFSPYSEGQVFRDIVKQLRINSTKVGEKFEKESKRIGSRNEIQKYLQDKIVSVIQRRPAIEQVVHQYQQVGSTIDLENLKNIYKKYDVSTLQEFYNDELTVLMSDLMPQFIQRLIIENGNNVVTNLFQIVQDDKKLSEGLIAGETNYEAQVIKYKEECIDFMYNVINDMRKKGQINTKVQEDTLRSRLNSRFSRAYLDNFLLTLRGVKVMARAIPPHANFDDVPYWNLVTRVFNPLHDWGKLGHRGRGGPRAGDAETYEFSAMQNFLIDEVAFKEKWKPQHGDIYDEFRPADILQEGKYRVLYKKFRDNKQLMEDLRSGRWDIFNTMSDVYHGLGVGNIVDQGGWPFKGFNAKTLPAAIEKWTAAKKGGAQSLDSMSWKEKLEAISSTAGVIPAFWSAEGQAGDERARMFYWYLARETIQKQEKELGRPLDADEKDEAAAHDKYHHDDYYRDKYYDQYTTGDDRFKKIFTVKHGNHEKGMTLREYGEYRKWALKGEVFHQLLLKDPLAWMGEMSQMIPELTQGYVTYKDSHGHDHNVLASKFYFDMKDPDDHELSMDDKTARDRFRFNALTKFRGRAEDDYMSNVQHLKKIMDFRAKLEDSFKGDKKAANDALYNRLSTAHRMAVKRESDHINPEDTINDGDTRIHDLMYGNDGLVTHFDTMVKSRKNYFGDGESDMGEENGFYQRWAFTYAQTNRKSLPEGDTNMDMLLDDVENPQMLERRLATNMTFAKGQEILAGIPSACKEAGSATSFEQWYGEMEKIHHDLAVLADEDQGIEQKYQQEAYIAICNYFSLDSRVEQMFSGFIYDTKLGNNKAIVSIKADYANKFMLDADARRLYLRKLREKTYLKSGYDLLSGAGFDTVEELAGISAFEIYGKQGVYALVGGALMIVAYAITKGYEEVEGED